MTSRPSLLDEVPQDVEDLRLHLADAVGPDDLDGVVVDDERRRTGSVATGAQRGSSLTSVIASTGSPRSAACRRSTSMSAHS